MPAPSHTMTVLFTDIVGSSKLYQTLGNAKAEKRIHFALQTLSQCVINYSGRIIKTIGDELMCAFDNQTLAADAAIEMNRLISDTGIELRTGISSGELIQRDNDLFGDVVNNASFLTKLARPKEILLDEMALNLDDTLLLKKVELIAEMASKGSDKICKIYRLDWEDSLALSMGSTMVHTFSDRSQVKKKRKLTLNYQGIRYRIDPKALPFTIGRDKANISLRIAHAKISRRHCSILLKQGKYIIEDHSTNGSYIKHDDGDTFMHRESQTLIGKGTIGLGQQDAEERCQIHFSVE